MKNKWSKETQRAIRAEKRLASCYSNMMEETDNPQVKAIVRDLLLMQEMNELLLRGLSQV